jgi:LytS/YehU family sensor histidine kinase
MVKEVDLGISRFILGILSVVFAVVSPAAGLITGIVGLSIGRKDKTELSKRGKKLSIIGTILSLIFLLAIVGFTFKYGV